MQRRVNKMANEDKKLLLELICNEQIALLVKDHNNYGSEKYIRLEKLKIWINDLQGGISIESD